MISHKEYSTSMDSESDDWNSRFIRIMQMPEDSMQDKLHKYSVLNGLNRDFIAASTTYAITIISEYFLNDSLKSVKLENIGGIAGGQKFMWRGILFKLANGDQGPYQHNDHYAAKAMGNELKGANSYFRCAIRDLNIGLQALIDYKGFRMHAQAVLPIDISTIKVGTYDGGRSIHASDDILLDKLKFAADELNLCPHIVGDKVMYTAADVEGHKGKTDGKYYLVDLARSFPPESYKIAECDEYSIFWRLLRPEFVKHRGLPLIQQVCQQREETLMNNINELRNSNNNSLHGISVPVLNRSRSEVEGVHVHSALPPSISIQRARTSVYSTSTIDVGVWNTSHQSLGKSSNYDALPYNTMSLHHEISTMTVSDISTEDILRITHDPIYDIMYDEPSESNNHNLNTDAYKFGSVMQNDVPILSRQESNTSQITIDSNVYSDYDYERNIRQRQQLHLLSTDKSITCPALSPDAYSMFSKSDPDAFKHNRNIDIATKILHYYLIPSLAEDLVVNGHPQSREGLSITEYMHKHGVNIRHMGLLRDYIYLHITGDQHNTTSIQNAIYDELLRECIVRTLKSQLRHFQRTWMKQLKTTSEDGMFKLIVSFLNSVSGASQDYEEFWQNTVIPAILDHFGKKALTPSEISNLFGKYLTGLDVINLLLSLCKVTGIVLTSVCIKQLQEMGMDAKGFEFTVPDIVEIRPVVKHMHQVDLGEGIMLSLQAELKESENSQETKTNVSGTTLRLISLAIAKLHAALKAVPDDSRTLHALADAYQTKGYVKSLRSNSVSVKEYNLFRTLTMNDSFARCRETRKYYREDILGYCIIVKYYKRGSQDNMRLKAYQNSNDFDSIRIHEIRALTQCLSLSFYERQSNASMLSMFPQQSGGDKPSGVVRFFPLVFDEEHFSRCHELLKQQIVMIDQFNDHEYTNYLNKKNEIITNDEISIPQLPILNAQIGLRVLSAMLTSMVVDFIKNYSNENETPSESALIGFTRVHHALLYLSRQDKEWKIEADRVVSRFLDETSDKRNEFPDIGRFLMYVLMSSHHWNNKIAEAIVTELLIRNVKWFAHSNPDLLVLETDLVCPYRLIRTFEATKESLRIIMFQIYFIKSVALKTRRGYDDNVLNLYNASLGRPTAAMMNTHRSEFDSISKVSNYNEFLKRVECEYTPLQLTIHLRNAIRKCQIKKYCHQNLSIIGDMQLEIIQTNECSSSNMSWEEVYSHTNSNDMVILREYKMTQVHTLNSKRKQSDNKSESFRSSNNKMKSNSNNEESKITEQPWQRGQKLQLSDASNRIPPTRNSHSNNSSFTRDSNSLSNKNSKRTFK